ncbi:MAG: hypothetical protein DI637_07670 [Citromicrobium sp.]|nr:MAG: hypothetical protein DI637_07670 [Citromicrobium sp.]
MDRLGGAFGAHEAEEHYDDGVEHSDADLGPPPSPVGQDERRMQVRAYNHWSALLGERTIPDIEDLEPAELEDFGPYSVLLDFSVGSEDPAVRFVGAKLRDECAVDGPLDRLSDVPARSLLSRITDHYLQIIANQAPIGFEAEFVNHRDIAVLYRGILLPYSSDGDTIDFVFGVINWKELADARTADELLLEIDKSLAETEDEKGSDDLADVLLLSDMLAETGDKGPIARERGLDVLGNRLGDLPQNAVGHDGDDFDEDFDSSLRTAADYGLPEWDDEPEDEDVDELVDPLADEVEGSTLMSLVNRGERSKKTVDLGDATTIAAIPQAFEGPVEPAPLDPANSQADDLPAQSAFEPDHMPRPILDAAEDAAVIAASAETAPAGLHACLNAARELAQAAQSTEDRSRKALYAAVGLAYDFSLEAQTAPDDFREIIEDNGLTIQDRAPMTPVVKLVFGPDYDKTRLTEYAAVLTHAHRLGVERGTLAHFLRDADGGLKGVVQAERRARKEEQGKAIEDDGTGVRPALARKLRGLEHDDLSAIATDGPEFALVMIRRTDDGELVMLGEVAEDRALLEKAARKLLAE